MLYWGGKTILEYSKEIKFSEKYPSFIPDPLDQQPRKIQLEADRKVFTNFWGFTVFEISSISGLLIYIYRRKKKLESEVISGTRIK